LGAIVSINANLAGGRKEYVNLDILSVLFGTNKRHIIASKDTEMFYKIRFIQNAMVREKGINQHKAGVILIPKSTIDVGEKFINRRILK